jgi:hypothetical protein
LPPKVAHSKRANSSTAVRDRLFRPEADHADASERPAERRACSRLTHIGNLLSVWAGVGYLAGGLLTWSVWLLWLIKGKAFSVNQVESIVRRYSRLRGPFRIVAHPWTSDRLRNDPKARARSAFWYWIPVAIFMPILATALTASAVVEFTR